MDDDSRALLASALYPSCLGVLEDLASRFLEATISFAAIICNAVLLCCRGGQL